MSTHFLDEQLSAGRDNQNRIRANLRSVPVKSDPHNRYMDELNNADALDAKYQTQLADVMVKKTGGGSGVAGLFGGIAVIQQFTNIPMSESG